MWPKWALSGPKWALSGPWVKPAPLGSWYHGKHHKIHLNYF